MMTETGVSEDQSLSDRLQQITGADKDIDAAIAAQFGAPVVEYTQSVDACRVLTATVLPGWRLHVGYGVSGLFPYAALTNGENRSAAEAPTVPLAILRALVGAAKLHAEPV